jgi:hypothetical protein
MESGFWHYFLQSIKMVCVKLMEMVNALKHSLSGRPATAPKAASVEQLSNSGGVFFISLRREPVQLQTPPVLSQLVTCLDVMAIMHILLFDQKSISACLQQ